ncbi:MAG: hypothetical protein ACKVWV_06785 [Planctomycetota bacterium]
MIENESQYTSLIERVHALERALERTLRPRVIEATEVRLIDELGKTRAAITVGEDGPYLTFPGADGEIRTELLAMVSWEPPVRRTFDPVRVMAWSEK